MHLLISTWVLYVLTVLSTLVYCLVRLVVDLPRDLTLNIEHIDKYSS